MWLKFPSLIILLYFKAQWGFSWFSCGRYNPCGISKQQFYFPSYYPQYFIQCGITPDQCYFQMCSPGTLWKQSILACVHDPNAPPPAPVIPVYPQSPIITGTYNCGDKDPCTVENAKANKFYFPHEISYLYVQCDNFRKCFIRYCNNGLVWDAAGYTCVPKPWSNYLTFKEVFLWVKLYKCNEYF